MSMLFANVAIWFIRQLFGRLFPESIGSSVFFATAPIVQASEHPAPSDAPHDARPYMVEAMMRLLALIRTAEGGKGGYNADFANNNHWVLVTRTFDNVIDLSRSQVSRGGEASSAVGAYQFLSTTLISLKTALRLTGKEIFNENFQDDLAVALMVRRGLILFLRGGISNYTFCNNLAKEWASLPVVTAISNGKRVVQPGQSYYAGDGLNKAFHRPADVIELVDALKEESWL